MSRSAEVRVARDLIIDLQTEFIMVPFGHLQGVARRVGGVARPRALGFLVELYRLAAVQGRVGESIYLTASQQGLGEEIHIGRNSVAQQLKILVEVGAVTVTQTVWDREHNGRETIRIEFKGQRVPFAKLSVPALVLIGRGLSGTNYLGALGLYVLLRQICFEQREHHGQRYAALSRPELAKITGGSPRWITSTGQLLERQGVVRREETRTENGGNGITHWWLLNITTEHLDRIADAATAGPAPSAQNEQPPVQNQSSPIAEIGHPPGQTQSSPAAAFPGTDGADFSERPAAADSSPPAAASATYARAGETGSEKDLTEKTSPPTFLHSGTRGEGTESVLTDSRQSECEAICTVFADWLVRDTSPSVLDRAGSWHLEREAWLAAAGQLLDDGYDAARVAGILEDLAGDIKVGDQLRHLTELPRKIHDVAKRAAHQRRARERQSPQRATATDHVYDELKQIVQRYGLGGYKRAEDAIAQLGPHAERYVQKAGWGALCNATQYDDGKLRRLWQDTATSPEPPS
jgi:hypothetical protein